MQKNVPQFETLNAYIDGELDAEHAAEVARAIANDGELAQQVAILSQLRSAVVDSIEIPELELPTSPSPRRLSRHWLVAACLAGLILISGGAINWATNDSQLAEGWLPGAWELHNSWVASPQNIGNSGTPSKLIPASSVPALEGLYVPDLTSAKLTVAHVTNQHSYRGKPSLLVGYTGTRGCKVSLLITPSTAPLSEQITYFEQGKASLYGWRAANLDYLLMAQGMAMPRFKSIAEAVYQATRMHLPVDNETRVALAKSRATSAPCLA